jgi:hypothetical protein
VETYDDVPYWQRGLEIQDSVPVPLYIDFMQFPRLRDAMVLGNLEIESVREEFDNNFRCKI